MADQPKLGIIIDANQQRDAVHVAIAPVIAGERLKPGQHVGFKDGDTTTVYAIAEGARGVQDKMAVGIIDPFLTVAIYPGNRVWLFLYPQTITSLRHEWTHPAFAAAVVPARESLSPSERWLRELADQLDMTYNALMRAATLWVTDEEYTVEFGSEHWRDTFLERGLAQQFWRHYEAVTGATVKDHEATFFSCSC